MKQMSNFRFQELAGVYIAKGEKEFYLFAVEMNERMGLNITIRNVPTPFSNESDHITDEQCVGISIRKRGYSSQETIGNLYQVEHNDACGLGKRMERGRAGTVDVVMTALALAKRLFEVQIFEFIDLSKIECEGKIISLRTYGLLTKGSTWYSRYFPNVFAARQRDQEALKRNEKILVERKITRDEAFRLSEATDPKYRAEIVNSVGETWRTMLKKFPCSFFGEHVTSVIIDLLRLKNPAAYRLQMTDEHVAKHLKNYKQIFKSMGR